MLDMWNARYPIMDEQSYYPHATAPILQFVKPEQCFVK
jgi:hypothetical protein